ncbi:MAG: hypothetical protein ACRDMK_04475 [Gaiellaceae bacterium]
MRRKKRFAIGWVALGLAVVAMVPVTAAAKPLPTDQSLAQYELNQAQGTLSPDDRAFSRVETAMLSPDDRAFSRVEQVETLSLSRGVGVTPDDRGFARVGPETTTIVATDDGSRFDVNPYLVSGFGLALLLLAGGMGIAIRQSRKTTLSPA